jgi:hypothetical protein
MNFLQIKKNSNYSIVLLLLIVDNWSFSLKLGDLMFQTANSFFFLLSKYVLLKKFFLTDPLKTILSKLSNTPGLEGQVRLGQVRRFISLSLFQGVF